MGRWRFDADDLVGRIAVRAPEAGLGWHQGNFSMDSGIAYPSDSGCRRLAGAKSAR
jgi:hypothetical protein